MSTKTAILMIATISFFLSTFLLGNADAELKQGCGVISQIWHHGEKIPEGNTKLLIVYRKNKPIKAKVGMTVKKGDRIEAQDAYVEFNIKWHRENETEERDESLFEALDKDKPIHVEIEECPEETVLHAVSNVINVIKSGKPFKIKTEPAIAGTPGTNFQIKLHEEGQAVKLIVTKGEAYLENKHGKVTVRESEVGTAKKCSLPTKKKVGKNYVSKEIQWLFDRTGVPRTYASEFQRWRVTVFAEEHGIRDTKILVGTTSALKGRLAKWGKGIQTGAQTYFNHINQSGGVHGRKIKYIVYNDFYDPGSAVENTKRLILKDDVFCLFSCFGTPTNRVITPIIVSNKIPHFSPASLSHSLTQVFNPYIFFLYPDYYTQAQKIAAYCIKKGRIAIIHEDTTYGIEGLQGTKYVLEGKGLKLVMEMKIGPSEKNFISQIRALKGQNPNSVILFTSDDQAGLIVKQALELSWKPQFIGPSPIATQDFLDISGEASEGNIVLSILPDPKTSQKAEVNKYRELLKKYFPKEKPSIPSLQGYTSAKVLVEALRRTRRYITREKFINALESMRGYETGIIEPVSFTPKDHLGTKTPIFNRVTKGVFVEF